MIDIKLAFNELNKELGKRDCSVDLTICGGALMILTGMPSRVTKDVDFITPNMSNELKEAKDAVAKSLGYERNWLNDNAKVYMNQLPEGWESRVISFLELSYLRVFGFSRQDSISSKLKAFIDRDFDREDLIDLSPSAEEFERAVCFVRGFNLDDVQELDIQIIKGELFDE
ncbi:MAG: hypothetical protein BM556_16865 [Bacteriovorax sp. MedPE-SWde]|nr:MAG: hypothetical protein BM556_16865 [Bacteriovorax sp. MedPE-SWde]